MWRHVYDIDMDIVKYKEYKRVKRKSELRSAPVAAQCRVWASAQGPRVGRAGAPSGVGRGPSRVRAVGPSPWAHRRLTARQA